MPSCEGVAGTWQGGVERRWQARAGLHCRRGQHAAGRQGCTAEQDRVPARVLGGGKACHKHPSHLQVVLHPGQQVGNVLVVPVLQGTLTSMVPFSMQRECTDRRQRALHRAPDCCTRCALQAATTWRRTCRAPTGQLRLLPTRPLGLCATLPSPPHACSDRLASALGSPFSTTAYSSDMGPTETRFFSAMSATRTSFSFCRRGMRRPPRKGVRAEATKAHRWPPWQGQAGCIC